MKFFVTIFSILLFVILILIVNFIFKENWLFNAIPNYEIDPINVLNLVFTSTSTLFLAWFLSKKLQEQRYEKEFLINDLKSIENEINRLVSLISNSSVIELNEMISKIETIRYELDKFKQTSIISNLSSINSKDLNIIHNKLFRNLTDFDGSSLDIDETWKIEKKRICQKYIIEIRTLINQINNY